MMIDGLRILSAAGVPVSEYRYVGFGSVHFVDFVMFHKLLGVRKLTSVEHSEDIKKRVEFNKPYGCVNVIIKSMSDVVPTLSRDERHILWLDYDDVLDQSQLEDVWAASATLSVGSMLIVTVDVQPPKNKHTPDEWKAYHEEMAGTYLGDQPVTMYTRQRLARVNIDALSRAMASGVAGRKDVELIPMFSFLYADTHEMLTIGCMIGTRYEGRLVRRSGLDDQIYSRDDFSREPYRIRVPIVTRRERAYLDRAMPCADGWAPEDFEMDPEEAALYRDVYRFLPAYAELLL